MKLKKSENIAISKEEMQSHDLHIEEKLAMRKEKTNKLNGNENCLLVVFDIENVINLPKTEVGSFFYKRKITLYNLTAMTSAKPGYCTIWTECMSGRARNDITSASFKFSRKLGMITRISLKLYAGPTVVFPKTGTPTFLRQFLNFYTHKSKLMK